MLGQANHRLDGKLRFMGSQNVIFPKSISASLVFVRLCKIIPNLFVGPFPFTDITQEHLIDTGCLLKACILLFYGCIP